MSARLWTLGVVGVEDLGNSLRAAFADHSLAMTAAEELGVEPMIESVDDHEGLDSWREFATWVEAGPFVICPPWISPPEGADTIMIDPGYSFGNGSHPTTRLSVAALAEVVEPDMSVLDVGCGSGVLSIAAARLGGRITAVDIDPAAVAATIANAALNDCATQITTSLGSASDTTGEFDLAVVNVTIDIHDIVAADVASRLSFGGIVVASGILVGEQERRLAAHFPDMELIARHTDEEWAVVTLQDKGHTA